MEQMYLHLGYCTVNGEKLLVLHLIYLNYFRLSLSGDLR